MPLLLSVYSNCYGPAGVRAAVEHLASLGVGHVELALRGHDFGGLVIPESAIINEATDAATAQSFFDLLRERNVAVSGCNVGGGDLRTAAGADLVARRIRFAAERFGARVGVLGIGQPAEGDERSRVVANLQRLGDLAASMGLVLSLETHSGPTQNADAMLRLMAEVAHPAIGINFDTGNIAYYNVGLDPAAELGRVKHHVRSVHLKDHRGQAGDWCFPALGDGAIDLARIKATLGAIDFAGPCTVEIEGIGGEPEPGFDERSQRVARSVAYWNSLG